MGLHNTTTEWGSAAKALHWLVAAGIFALIWLGLQQSGLERGPEKTEIRALHGSIALIVFALMSARALLRVSSSAPAHPPGMPGWQRLSSTVVHWGLYVSVFVQLVAGAMTVATTGKGLPFFGLFSLPLPVAQSDEGHHFWEEIHETVWIAIAALLSIHILGALYNHFIVKNDVLRRMTVGVKN